MIIRLYEHPFAPVAPQEFQVDSLGLWLLQHYGETPQVGVQIFAGEPSAQTDITGNLQAILHARGPVYTVLQSPGDPISILTNIAISMVLSFVLQMLTPSPSMPSNVNRTQESPNNALGSRENRVRLLERVEDIYGTVRSIPSLMMPTYNKYIQHRKVEYGYYCVGRGYYDIAELRDGDSLISDITGASAAVYAPFTSPNSGHAPQEQIGPAIIDDILTVARSVQVDGITLKAYNQVQLPASAAYTFYPANSGAGPEPTVGTDLIAQNQTRPNFNAIAETGQTVTISMDPFDVVRNGNVTANALFDSFVSDISEGAQDVFSGFDVGTVFAISGFTSAANNGTFTVLTKLSYGVTVAASLVDEVASIVASTTVDYSGTRTIAGVGDGYLVLSTAEFITSTSVPSVAVTVGNGLADWTDWATLRQLDRTQVWCNILAVNGMYKDNGGKANTSVAYAVEIERLDPATMAPTGQVEVATGSLNGATSEERAETLERVTAWVGPARVRVRRTTPFDYDFNGTVIDEIKWADLYAVSPVDRLAFGNKTTVHTVTYATARATASRQRQLNCIAARRLPVFDGTNFSGAFDADGRHTSGTIAATSRIVDIIAAVSLDPKIGQRNLATDVDMAQVWGVQQQLAAWRPDVGQFNYTFDSDALSFEETVTTIANAAFCVAYRQSGKIRLALDQVQASSSALFTHRNKRPASETVTRKFAADAEYDGVEFVYQDPETQQSETIKLPLDGSASKLKKFEIPGIRNFAQAWLRANREHRKLLGQRISIETECTTDARLLLPGARVDIVDNTRFKSFDGEVIAQSGLEVTLSQDVQFTPAAPHSILLMRRDGSLQPIACTPGSGANKVVLASVPSEAIVTTPGDEGIRTIFSFASDNARAAQAWIVQEIGRGDGQYMPLRAVNYSADYYAADHAAIPDKNSVIN